MFYRPLLPLRRLRLLGRTWQEVSETLKLVCSEFGDIEGSMRREGVVLARAGQWSRRKASELVENSPGDACEEDLKSEVAGTLPSISSKMKVSVSREGETSTLVTSSSSYVTACTMPLSAIVGWPSLWSSILPVATGSVACDASSKTSASDYRDVSYGCRKGLPGELKVGIIHLLRRAFQVYNRDIVLAWYTVWWSDSCGNYKRLQRLTVQHG